MEETAPFAESCIHIEIISLALLSICQSSAKGVLGKVNGCNIGKKMPKFNIYIQSQI